MLRVQHLSLRVRGSSGGIPGAREGFSAPGSTVVPFVSWEIVGFPQ